MTKTSRARYTFESKQEAVRLAENGQSIAAVARTLGVVDQTLFNWVKAHRQCELTGADSKAPVSAEQMETSRLRAELARVKMERDILGKAMAHTMREGRFEVHLHPAAPPPVAGLGAVQCQVLQVSTSGHHAHLVRRAGSARRRHLSDEALLVHIKALHAEMRNACGWPCIRVPQHPRCSQLSLAFLSGIVCHRMLTG